MSDRRARTIQALVFAGAAMRATAGLVPGPAGAGIRLGAALVAGLVHALDGKDAEELLAELTGKPLKDIIASAEAQDDHIDALMREKFGD